MAITALKRETWRRKLMLERDALNHWHITTVQHIPLMNGNELVLQVVNIYC